MDEKKVAHTIVLDAGPIIKNEPSVSSLLAQAERLVTTPTVISELRDQVTRTRVENTLLPFLTLRSPHPSSIKFVTEFARKTGDAAVLSGADIELIALAYDVECERNGGDWRLRRTPGQKGLNGTPPGDSTSAAEKAGEEGTPSTSTDTQTNQQGPSEGEVALPQETGEGTTEPIPLDPAGTRKHTPEDGTERASEAKRQIEAPDFEAPEEASQEEALPELEKLDINPESPSERSPTETPEDPAADPPTEAQEDDDDDSDGWITPANIKKYQQKDTQGATKEGATRKPVEVAIITSDFAMQNVILSMNLNLLSASFQRVRQIKTFILRCHACFLQTKDMTKQFCPRCGMPTLTRVSCSTNQNGEFKIFLKRNMQWNTRGDRYSIPKPVAGTASGKFSSPGTKGGGKGGWGRDLILTEDQKEYTRAIEKDRRQRQRDPLDDDFLPGILSGERSKTSGRPRVGAGRNVNSKRRT